MVSEPTQEKSFQLETLEQKRLELEIREREWTLSGVGKLVRVAPFISVVLLAISIVGSTYWYVTQERLETERLRQETITNLKKEFADEDPKHRIGAAVALVDYPREAIALLTSSSSLGAIDQTTLREQAEFTNVVKDALRQIGKEAVSPLVRELKRIQMEIASNYPQKLWSNSKARISKAFLNLDSFHLSHEDLKQNLRSELESVQPHLAEPEIDSTLNKLFQVKALELRVANKNAQETIADLLRSLEIEKLNLADLYITGNFSGACLRGANLAGADMERAELIGTELQRANLSEANLTTVNLSGARLDGVDLSGANLNITDLSDASLVAANLSDTMADGADLSGANLSKAKLAHARLPGVRFSKCNLAGADLTGGILNRADFSDADLTDATLGLAILKEANLSFIKGFRTVKDLRMTNIKDVKGLSNQDLEYAKSMGAEFANRVAVALNALPSDVHFPGHFEGRIDYDRAAKLLIWDGGMSRKEYVELRNLSGDVSYGNAILELFGQAFWVR